MPDEHLVWCARAHDPPSVVENCDAIDEVQHVVRCMFDHDERPASSLNEPFNRRPDLRGTFRIDVRDRFVEHQDVRARDD